MRQSASNLLCWYVADAKNDSGLVFYTKKKLETKPAPQTVPAPSLSRKDAEELARQMHAVRDQGKKEGRTTVQEIGMVVLIGLAIAAAIAVAVFALGTGVAQPRKPRARKRNRGCWMV